MFMFVGRSRHIYVYIYTPYLLTKYRVKSIHELIQILRTQKLNKIAASFVVERLFTNVSVKETIDIIINNI